MVKVVFDTFLQKYLTEVPKKYWDIRDFLEILYDKMRGIYSAQSNLTTPEIKVK